MTRQKHRRSSWSPHRGAGFTLIELMITAAIIAILAAVAIPSYRDSVWKGKRGEAKAAILRTLQTEERYYTQFNQYLTYPLPGALPSSGSPFSNFSADNAANSRYAISVVPATCTSTGVNQCVTVVATVIGGGADPLCGTTLSMDTTGKKLPTTAGCW